MNPEMRWEKISQETIVNSPWIRVNNNCYKLPNGHEVKDYFIVEKPDVVIIIPFTENNETYLIQEWERGVEEIGFKFPAGRVNKNELPALAAQREFEEELGISVESQNLQYLGSSDVEPGFMPTKAHYFLARVKNSIIDESEREQSELFIGSWTSWQQIQLRIQKNEIHNPFIIIGASFVDSYLKNI